MSQSVRRCILITGTMCAGKTTVCKELMRLLPHSAFLDGDWCWYSDPFTVNDRTKEMVLQNIGFVLSNLIINVKGSRIALDETMARRVML